MGATDGAGVPAAAGLAAFPPELAGEGVGLGSPVTSTITGGVGAAAGTPGTALAAGTASADEDGEGEGAADVDAEGEGEAPWSEGCVAQPAMAAKAPSVTNRVENLTFFIYPLTSHFGKAFRLKALVSRRRTPRPMDATAASPTLSIVVPLYNEEGNVQPLLDRIVGIAERLPGITSYEIVLVNDGSTDGTLAQIRKQMRARENIVAVSLSRNFGHQVAATAGIDMARGEAVVLMDGDLQDPPELIASFIEKWREGYDVVYAVRRTRKGESAFKLFTARVFYRTIKRLTKVSIPVDTGDFRLMSRRVVEALQRSPERHRFLRGLVSWVGFNQTGVDYDRDERHSGSTKYPLPKMLRFAIDGITSFSDVPLRFASYLGFVTSVAAFLYALVIVFDKLFSINPPEYTRGWASTIVAILFLGGVQLICLGILGEYIGRIYDEVKGRPLYLISEIERS
jgi:dolichol-phosphate mannosyltransferase